MSWRHCRPGRRQAITGPTPITPARTFFAFVPEHFLLLSQNIFRALFAFVYIHTYIPTAARARGKIRNAASARPSAAPSLLFRTPGRPESRIRLPRHYCRPCLPPLRRANRARQCQRNTRHCALAARGMHLHRLRLRLPRLCPTPVVRAFCARICYVRSEKPLRT